MHHLQYQLSPPDNHWSNAAECTIQTAKSHLAAGWWSTDDNFPMYLWDKTIPHAEQILNLLRGVRIAPQLSAWGASTDSTISTPNLLHHRESKVWPMSSQPHAKHGWAPHAVEGWYVGPALQHYHCHTICAKGTSHTQIVDQLQWFPKQVSPCLNSTNLLCVTHHPALSITYGHIRQEHEQHPTW